MIIDIAPTLQLHAYSILASPRLTIRTSNLHSPEQKLLLRSSPPKHVSFAPTTTDQPPPRHPAALRVTNCLIDRYPMAAVDSGATHNFFPENYNGTAPNSEGPKISASGIMGMLTGKKGAGGMSGTMSGFLDCMAKVDKELSSTAGPWFFDKNYHTMIDFVFVSHVERMIASCAYWKGLNLRDEEMKKGKKEEGGEKSRKGERKKEEGRVRKRRERRGRISECRQGYGGLGKVK